ncbi:hypothetical protein IWW48_004539 [Coemansia sp. RSA 1200]|nr:hypothetical protein IWW48_004539 [Coemansia sp. RSA 1200]
MALLSTLHCVAAMPASLSKRLVAADMVNFPGAILVKNGQATTCEFGLIDNRAAFVAASCLDYTSNGNLDTSTSYEIFFSATTDHGASKASISSKDIHIHPHYNPTTLADNIAVVEYNFTERGSWVNYIAVYKSEWTSQYYVRRRLYDASKQSWWGAYINGYTGFAPTCSTLSPLYAQNTDTLLCNQIQTSSAWNKSCPMPYGSIYGIVSEGMAIGGLYSHSLMFDADYCSGTRGLYHFVLLGNYVNWGESVIQRNINKLVHDTTAYANSAQSSSYSMADVPNPNPSEMHLYAGNLVSPVAWSSNEAGALASSVVSSGSGGTTTSSLSVSKTPGKEIDDSAGANASVSDTVAGGSLGLFNTADNGNSLSSMSAGSEPTPNSSGGIPDDNLDQGSIDTNTDEYLNPADHTSLFPQPTYIIYTDFSDPANGNNNSGNLNGSEPASQHGTLGKGAIIAVAVSVPTTVIMLAVSGFLLFKKWKPNLRLPKKQPRVQETQNTRRELVEEIGGASEEEQLPSYDEIHDLSRFSQFTDAS